MERKKTFWTVLVFLIMVGTSLLLTIKVHAGHDTTAPVLNSISIGTPTVTKPGIANIVLDITENDTGVNEVYVTIERKTRQADSFAGGIYPEIDNKVFFTGKASIQIKIPSSTPSDQYFVSQVYLKDSAGNSSGYSSYWENDDQNNLIRQDLVLGKMNDQGFLDESVLVRSNGYVSIEDEFDVFFEYAISNPNVTSKINSMPEGEAAMIIFTSNNANANKDWFDAIKGKDKTLVFSNDGIQWMINGKDITNDTKNINLNIVCEKANAEDFGGSGEVVILTFADNGTLPGKARIRIKSDYILGTGFNLYYRDGSSITLERSDGRGFLDGDNVWAEFYVTHNSTFVLSKNKLTKSNIASSGGGNQPATEAPALIASDKVTAEPAPTIAKTPSSVKAKVKKNKVTVSWKKIKKTKKTKKLLGKIKGIQIQYANDPAFVQNPVTKSIGKNKTKVSLKLKKKTTYYIRVRYIGKDGVSKWTKAKKVKTK